MRACNMPAVCRYDPYGRTLSVEEYDQRGMREARRSAIVRAQSAKTWGVVLGTLGRQGNPAVAQKLEALLQERRLDYLVVLMSELSPESLALMPAVDAWVQVACPRCAPPLAAAHVTSPAACCGAVPLSCTLQLYSSRMDHRRAVCVLLGALAR
jgi:diphthamide biosynthesis enzyme Dph1/Dph2-like protein